MPVGRAGSGSFFPFFFSERKFFVSLTKQLFNDSVGMESRFGELLLQSADEFPFSWRNFIGMVS